MMRVVGQDMVLAGGDQHADARIRGEPGQALAKSSWQQIPQRAHGEPLTIVRPEIVVRLVGAASTKACACS